MWVYFDMWMFCVYEVVVLEEFVFDVDIGDCNGYDCFFLNQGLVLGKGEFNCV